jgi:hypothetical protein
MRLVTLQDEKPGSMKRKTAGKRFFISGAFPKRDKNPRISPGFLFSSLPFHFLVLAFGSLLPMKNKEPNRHVRKALIRLFRAADRAVSAGKEIEAARRRLRRVSVGNKKRES